MKSHELILRAWVLISQVGKDGNVSWFLQLALPDNDTVIFVPITKGDADKITAITKH